MANGEVSDLFTFITENIYKVEKKNLRYSKEIHSIECNCEIDYSTEYPKCCGNFCLNRQLFIECNKNCRGFDYCLNKNFQKGSIYKLDVFKTQNKGYGLFTKTMIPCDSFITEYVGEVIDLNECFRRMETKSTREIFYMSLNNNHIIDSSFYGNYSRFLNHSCSPNSILQKWTVNGYMRIGVFSISNINENDEITIDYRLMKFGTQNERCFCGFVNCKGYIAISSFKSTNSQNSISNGMIMNDEETKNIEKFTQNFDKYKEELDQTKVITLMSLMIKTTIIEYRHLILSKMKLLENTSIMKMFIRFNFLSLIWSWMLEIDSFHQTFLNYYMDILIIVQTFFLVDNKKTDEQSKIIRLLDKWISRFLDMEKELNKNNILEMDQIIKDKFLNEIKKINQIWQTKIEIFKIPKKRNYNETTNLTPNEIIDKPLSYINNFTNTGNQNATKISYSKYNKLSDLHVSNSTNVSVSANDDIDNNHDMKNLQFITNENNKSRNDLTIDTKNDYEYPKPLKPTMLTLYPYDKNNKSSSNTNNSNFHNLINRDEFKRLVSAFVVEFLHKYPKTSFSILSQSVLFKKIAKKLTHAIVEKEIKSQLHRYNDMLYENFNPEFSEAVKIKSKHYIEYYLKKKNI